MTKVSVIIAAKNAETTLERTLHSVLAQSLDSFEVICVDDCSTDDTFKILEAMQSIDSRVIAKKGNGHGAGAARNIGLRFATGEYVVFLDSDDTFDKNLLLFEYNSAICHNSDIVICCARDFDVKTGKRVSRKLDQILKSKLPTGGLISSKEILDRPFTSFYPALWDKMFKRTFLVKNQIECMEVPVSNDLFFTYKALLCGKRISFVPKELVEYHTGQESSIQSKKEKYPIGAFEALANVWTEMKKCPNADDLTADFISRALSEFYYYFTTFKSSGARNRLINFWISTYPFGEFSTKSQPNTYNVKLHQLLYIDGLIKMKQDNVEFKSKEREQSLFDKLMVIAYSIIHK